MVLYIDIENKAISGSCKVKDIRTYGLVEASIKRGGENATN